MILVALLGAACGGAAETASHQTIPLRRAAVSDGEGPSTNSPPAWGAAGALTFKHLTLEDGLSQTSINCILQDAQGFMWFGTQDGLNRYDGYHVTVYKPIPGENSLGTNYVTALYEDQAGVLWVGTEGGGVDRFDRGENRFVHYRSDPGDPDSLSSDYIRSIAGGEGNTLWIATLGGGVDHFDPETERFDHYRHRPGDPNSLSSNGVECLYPDRDGSIWVGTDAGLNRLDPNTGTVTRYRHYPGGPSGDTVQAIHQDREGTLWVGTNRGVNGFDRDKELFTLYQPVPGQGDSLVANDVHAILQDAHGALWVGTVSGLNRFDPNAGGFTRYVADAEEPDTLSNDVVLSLYEDAEGSLWVGTYGGGVNRAHPSTASFLHYESDPDDPGSLAGNHVWSIYEDRRGTLWVGLAGPGLDRLDPGADRFFHYGPSSGEGSSTRSAAGLSDGRVRAILEDNEGRLWIGTENGLNALDPGTERFVHYLHNPNDPHSLSENRVTEVYEDSRGRLWIGTFGGGLNQMDPETGRFTAYPGSRASEALRQSVVWAIAEDGDGTLWLGTGGHGLNRLDPEHGRVTRYVHDPEDLQSLSDDMVLAIHVDRRGTLWAGTAGGGLNRFDREEETFRVYRKEDGLPNDVVYGILEDDQGHLWLSTNQGLSRFDPQSETFHNYDAGDGLQSNEFNAGAYHRNAEGRIFFGGINGFNAFYPEDIQANDYVPPVVLTSLTQGGESIVSHGAPESVPAITLNWPNDYFEFEFAALSYVRPSKNAYAYKLEGFDDDWIHTGNRRFGRYTSLPAGTYTLRVTGCNNDGVCNEEGASVKVRVVPPFWATFWFRSGLVILLLGAAAAGYRARVRGMRARSRELERQVAERTEELAAVNTIADVVSRSLNLNEMLGDALDKTLEVMGIERGGIYLLDDEAGVLSIAVQRGFSPDVVSEIDRLSVGEGFSGRVVQTGDPLVVRDMSQDPRLTRMAVQDEGLHSLAVVPLTVKSSVLGTLFLVTLGYRTFGDQEVELLVAIGQQIGMAVENARLYEDTKHRLAQLTALQETTAAVAGTLELEKLLRLIVQDAVRLLGAEGGILNLVDWDTREDEVVAAAGVAANTMGQRQGLEAGLSGWVALHDQAVVSNDARADERVNQPGWAKMESASGRRIRKAAAAPLRIKDQVVGTLVILDTEGGEGDFNQSDLKLLQAFANQAATAIDNARLFQGEQRRAEQFRVISEVGRRITSIASIDSVLQQVAELIQCAFGYDHVGIALVEGDVASYRVGAGRLWEGGDFKFSPADLKVGEEGITGWVAGSGEPLLVPDVREEPRYVWMRGSETLSELTVPIKLKGEVIGILDAQSDQLAAFDESDLAVLQSLADQAAIAIENARLYEQARQLAVVEERQRLARELHDSVTQALYGTTLYAEAAARQLATGQADLASEHLRELRATAQEALREMRLLIFELRPSVLDDEGLVDALRARLEAVEERAGLEIAFHADGEMVLPASVEEGLYRIAQEALNNALKHACAQRVSVSLEMSEETVFLEVVDDGCGFDPATAVRAGGLGLDGIIERAAQMGGELTLDSTPGEGTRVRVKVPR